MFIFQVDGTKNCYLDYRMCQSTSTASGEMELLTFNESKGGDGS